jgi:YD repeat-containing protein
VETIKNKVDYGDFYKPLISGFVSGYDDGLLAIYGIRRKRYLYLDDLNRLTRVQYPDGSVIEYTYDAAGNRLTRNVTVPAPANQSPATNTNPNQTPGAGNTPPANQPPTAQAGPDQTANLGAKVSLDGSGSADPDQGPAPLAYAWVQTEGPSIALDNAASMAPSFTPAAPGTYTFSLTVSDGAATSPADAVSVTVGDVPVLVLSPNGGEIWKAGIVQTLQWYVSGTLANTSKPVTIRFSKNGGKKWKKLKKVSAAANSFQWRPKRADRSTQARIQICLAPVGKKAKPVCDASGGNFTIQK